MLAEWIKLLGLDGGDPPWEGEPMAIRAKCKIDDDDDVMVRIVSIVKGEEGLIFRVQQIEYLYQDISAIAEAKRDTVIVTMDNLFEIILVY